MRSGTIEVPSAAVHLAQGIAAVLVHRVAEMTLGPAAVERIDAEDIDQQNEGAPPAAAVADVPAAKLSKLCFVLGHVGLQHLVR